MPQIIRQFLLVACLALFAVGCAEDPEVETDLEAEEGVTEEVAPEDELAGDVAGEQAAVGVNEQQPYGSYLVDSEGRSLYLFMADEGQQGSACYDDCANAWPPLLTTGEPVAEDPAVDASLLGTIQRDDGSMQVTYGGWPLYYFVQDSQPGDVQGQDVTGFGAEWYLVSPQGEAVHAQ